MKACVLHGIADLRYEDVSTPAPGEGEVLVEIGACGVCGSDIPRVFSKGTYRFPTIPGHEFAGTVAETAPGVDPAWRGARVAVFPLIPCRVCGPCTMGEYAMCENYNYLGSRCDGAFADYAIAPVWNLLRLPDEVSLLEGAMTEPAAVAVHALRRAGVDIGDSVLIFGAGPIGLMVAMWARAWGAAKVLLADIDAAKLEFARGLGFAETVHAGAEDPIAWTFAHTERGAHVVIEASGSSAAFENAVRAARTFGRVVLLGNPAGSMTLTQDGYWAILRKELRVFGSWNSSYSELPKNEWKLAIDFMRDKRLDLRPLVTHPVALDALPDALIRMRDRVEFMNKTMFVADAEG